MDARSTAGGAVVWLRSRSIRAVLPVAAPAAIALLLVGCQADPNMQLVERELRLQDSHIFELEEHLADCHATVAECRREVESLRRRLADGSPDLPESPEAGDYGADDADWNPDARLRPPRPGGPALPEIDEGDEIRAAPRRVPLDADSPLDQLDDVGEAEAPEFMPLPDEVEPPTPTPATPEAARSLPRYTHDSAVPASGLVDDNLPPRHFTELDHKVEQIGLRLMVRYHAAENTPVELQTLIEPQDAEAGQVVTEGHVSLMVVATDGGAERPLARWDFTEEEARSHWERSRLGTGMLFSLPWPGTPQPGQYRLWARMVGADGRKHLSSVDFEIQDNALAETPPMLATPMLVLPEPNDAAEVESTGESAASSSEADESPQEPEPFVPSEGQPEPLRSPEPGETAAAASSPLLSRAPSSGLAWRASVEAARLPRLPQPVLTTVSPTAADDGTDDRRSVLWSPERPHANDSPEPQTAKMPDMWSPFR